MLPKGDVIFKAVKNSYQITHGSAYSHVFGTQYITIDKGMEVFVNSKSGSQGLILKVGSGGDMNITVASGNVNLTVNGDVKETISGDYVVEVGGQYKITASTINLN
jgi:hypothetical protein